MADLKLTDEIRAALESAGYTGTSITLRGTLDRRLYVKVNTFIEAAGGKWSRKNKCHEFTTDPKVALGLTIAAGVVVDEKKKFQAFYTPPDLAERVIALADVAGHRVLEPSCGQGALIKAALDEGAEFVHGIELDDRAIAVVQGQLEAADEHRVTLRCADFLELSGVVIPYLRITMNPPFTKKQDQKHVRHAYQKWLSPGGRLVAIMSPPGAARIKEEFPHAETHEVAAGAFKESGTNVATVIVVLNKPETQQRTRTRPAP